MFSRATKSKPGNDWRLHFGSFRPPDTVGGLFLGEEVELAAPFGLPPGLISETAYSRLHVAYDNDGCFVTGQGPRYR